MSVKTRFFPKDRTFWLYHCLGLLAIASIDTFTILFAPHMAGFKLWSSWVLWPPLFTLAVLSFRWLYQNHGLFKKTTGQLIPIVIIYATLSAMFAAVVITSLLLPFFWQNMVSPDLAASGQVNLLKVGLPIATGATLSGQLFVIAWTLIYISIIQSRKAREQELHNVRLQNALKDAQLTTLQSQLNPHFLFNALNNIRFVIYENAEVADRMLTSLSELLRYSLSATSQSQVPLSQELAMTIHFVNLIKLQHEDKLHFDLQVNVDDSALSVPPMSIQTLVENAVKHGLELLPQGGTIAVRIQPSFHIDSHWEVTVTNPVPSARQVSSKDMHHTGTGLKNIRHRINLLFGENAKLETQQPPDQFIAKLTLPKEN